MARKVQVHLLDDIDGGKADETLKFALDGTNYEIDLSAKHAQLFVLDLLYLLVAQQNFGAVATHLAASAMAVSGHRRVLPGAAGDLATDREGVHA